MTDLSPTLLIVLGLVCIFLGYMASVLIHTLRDESVASASVDEAPPGGKRGRYTPITRLWREKQAGGLVVEINGKSYVAPTPLSDAERDALEQVARDLRGWLGIGLANGAGAAVKATVAAPAVTAPVEATPAPGSPAPDFLAPNPESKTAPIPDVPPPYPPETVQPLSGTSTASSTTAAAIPLPPPGTRLKSMTGAKEESPLPPAAARNRSIVMQIDDVLQDMLLHSPLGSRGIKLTEDPVRGVIVYVGINHYDGIDNVPDPEIKAFIRQAVQTWESTQ